MSEEKKNVIERMATKFVNISTIEGKAMAVAIIVAFENGFAAGVEKERSRWEQKQQIGV